MVNERTDYRPPRSRKGWIAAGIVLIAVIGWLPGVIVQSPLRRWILNDLLAVEGIEASIGSLKVGWFTPMTISQLSLGPIGEKRLLEVDRVISDRTLSSALWQGIDVGKLEVEHPVVRIIADEQGSNLDFPRSKRANSHEGDNSPQNAINADSTAPAMELTIRDASLWLKATSMTSPAMVFEGLDLQGTLRRDPKVVTIEPRRIVDHARVSPELFAGGLKYVLPLLAEATWAEGELSLDLEQCECNLDDPGRSWIVGKLTIHGVDAGIRHGLLQQWISRLVPKDDPTKSQTIRIADDSVVSFEIRDGLVAHQGLAFGLPQVAPDLVVRSQGTVSLDDERVDLQVELPLPLNLVANGPLAQALTGQGLTMHVGGTLDQLEWKIDNESQVGALLERVGTRLAEEERPLRSLLDGFRDSLRGSASVENDARTESVDGSDETQTDQESAMPPSLEGGDASPRPKRPLLDRLRRFRSNR